MLSDSIVEFSAQFHDEIRAEASAQDAMREEVFVQKMGEVLEDYGEIDSFIPSSYQAHGLKVDGYSFDDEFQQLTIIVSHYFDDENPDNARLTNSVVNKVFQRAENFFVRSQKGLANKIEIANEAFELSRLIEETGSKIAEVRFILICDGQVPRLEADVYEIDDVAAKRLVWGIDRTAHFCSTGEREVIELDFEEFMGSSLPCVKFDSSNGVYSNYLAFIPGQFLADLYQRWGIRMLEMNVRVFLSARTKVNKGIRDTIREEPAMFCAYNNGISAFAREVEIVSDGGGMAISTARDFQIVNGGQTTASLFHTWKKNKADLENTTVQMKLTVIHDTESIGALVPKISEYSNTQNKVQLADLAANESPHPEIQQISNNLLAPDPTGGSRQTYWFYERARGSYEEFRNLTARTPAQKRAFDDLRPKKQRFDKLIFAKVWNAYLRLPHIVSLGGQKSFARFNVWLQEQQGEDWEAFFKKTVALVKLWKEVETIVRRQKFKGYRHNLVAYTISWLFMLTDMKLDLDKIWLNQKLSEVVLETCEALSFIVNEHIRDTDFNVTEWCKKEECWDNLKGKHFELDTRISDDYLTGKAKVMDSSIAGEAEIIEFCTDKPSDAWFSLAKWLKERDFLTGVARSQCFNMGKAISRGKEPSIRLSTPCKKHWEQAELRGWDWKEAD
jgi:hypothetical protein